MDAFNNVVINNIPYSLTDLEIDTWNRLVNGAVKSRDPLHTPCVATHSGNDISLRTVVLRKAIPETKELRFHTDTRSKKWQELTLNPSISALFYDAADRIQIRLKGRAELQLNNDITADAWQKTSLSSRRCYLTNFDPSSFTDNPTSGLPEHIEQENFTLEESEMGYQNFGIVSIKVQNIDWLWLHHAGHRRAYFDYVSGSFSWMIP
ncbi:MAG: pyridoxamine 5'-phosphate oxidase family protein [Sediminibacterium sp.]